MHACVLLSYGGSDPAVHVMSYTALLHAVLVGVMPLLTKCAPRVLVLHVCTACRYLDTAALGGVMPLHIACTAGQLDVVKELLKYAPDINAAT
jgi:hypothetical protein